MKNILCITAFLMSALAFSQFGSGNKEFVAGDGAFDGGFFGYGVSPGALPHNYDITASCEENNHSTYRRYVPDGFFGFNQVTQPSNGIWFIGSNLTNVTLDPDTFSTSQNPIVFSNANLEVYVMDISHSRLILDFVVIDENLEGCVQSLGINYIHSFNETYLNTISFNNDCCVTTPPPPPPPEECDPLFNTSTHNTNNCEFECITFVKEDENCEDCPVQECYDVSMAFSNGTSTTIQVDFSNSNIITECFENDIRLVDFEECSPNINTRQKYYDIKVFPNPSKGTFNIHSNNFENESIEYLRIFNLNGIQVKKISYKSDQNFNISDLKQGSYILKTYDESGKIISTDRLIKQN